MTIYITQYQYFCPLSYLMNGNCYVIKHVCVGRIRSSTRQQFEVKENADTNSTRPLGDADLLNRIIYGYLQIKRPERLKSRSSLFLACP